MTDVHSLYLLVRRLLHSFREIQKFVGKEKGTLHDL